MTPHHGDELLRQSELLEMLKRQKETGLPEGSFSQGKLTPSDEGDLAYRIAADPRRQKIVIDFGKPVAWIGLDRESAEQLRDNLTTKLMELRGIKP